MLVSTPAVGCAPGDDLHEPVRLVGDAGLDRIGAPEPVMLVPTRAVGCAVVKTLLSDAGLDTMSPCAWVSPCPGR